MGKKNIELSREPSILALPKSNDKQRVTHDNDNENEPVIFFDLLNKEASELIDIGDTTAAVCHGGGNRKKSKGKDDDKHKNMEARGANDTALTSIATAEASNNGNNQNVDISDGTQTSVSVNVANKQVVHHTREAGRRGAVKIGSSVDIGDVAPDFELEDSMGINHKLSSYKGRKVLLSFFKFAACHICLSDIDMMKKQYDIMRKAGIIIICIFNSTPDNISRFASDTLGDGLLALSDKKGSTYKSYKVKQSTKPIFQSPVETLLHWVSRAFAVLC